MNIIIALTLMSVCLGTLVSLLDQTWYAGATVQLLKKQVVKQYAEEKRAAYERAIAAQREMKAKKKPR